MLKIAIDGSVDGQFGPAGVGMVIIHDGQQRQEKYPLSGEMDNHEAEFHALLLLLEKLQAEGLKNEWILCQTDSKIVFDAVNKRFHKRDPYKSLLKAILNQLDHFPMFNLKWVPDQANRGADNLARQAMHQAKKISNQQN
ncbi:ribonuclease HI family protein [Aerococcus urinaeequi]|uniref:ribonuclease HI family protein n=1 Tax=Aerococcus urinaeequi TaxID=51665 RepID=UPI003AAD4158